MSRLLAYCLTLALGIAPVSCGGDSSRKTETAQKKKRKDKKKRKKSRSKKKKASKPKLSGADVNYRRAINAENDGDIRKATKYYERVIDEEPTHLRANQRYVHFLIDIGSNGKALRVATKFHEEVSGQAISYHTLADAERANKEHERVIGTITALLAFSEEDAAAYEKRGRARLIVGENEGGIRDIKRALKLEPNNPGFLLSLAGGLLRTGEGKAAKRTLLKVLTIDEDSARARLMLGVLARGDGRLEEAREFHEAAVELEPSDPRAQYELGITLNVAGKNSEAEKYFEAAVDLDPENGTYWYGYGELFRVLGKMEDAGAAYRECVKLQPLNARAWERLGEALLATDELKSAAKYLRRGIGKVDHARLYFVLGKVYVASKKKERAIEAFENFLDASAAKAPGAKEAKRYLKRLR